MPYPCCMPKLSVSLGMLTVPNKRNLLLPGATEVGAAVPRPAFTTLNRKFYDTLTPDRHRACAVPTRFPLARHASISINVSKERRHCRIPSRFDWQVTLNHGSHRREARYRIRYQKSAERIPRQVRPLQTDQSVTNRRTPTLVMKRGTPRRAEKVKSRFGASTRLASSGRLAPPNTAADL
jgi:hypothetical protein